MPESLPPIPQICAICQSHHGEIKQTIPLCEACRGKHVKLAVPKFLKIFAVLVGIVFLYVAVRSPRELMAAITWDRGDTAWDAKNYGEAVRQYELALQYYPQSPSVWGRIGRSARANGDTPNLTRQSKHWGS